LFPLNVFHAATFSLTEGFSLHALNTIKKNKNKNPTTTTTTKQPQNPRKTEKPVIFYKNTTILLS